MKITPTLPSPVKGEERSEGAFSYKPPCLLGVQRSMKMPIVIPDSIRNPCRLPIFLTLDGGGMVDEKISLTLMQF
ncbi:MAG: hypothetical protein COX16_02035 [Deltaproteobacteria bacterium CG23_combo_of_CG06-09_8_20_14_all_51_20]|nr:MAG: hypothetical protein AUK25_15710 [Desulfobacteraceae bacterium CG2_30_51_40]PIP48071.1 MAG: hypothetical protein COX16_02035 [Deltaproteobacteria bacterium CG23_combo_of_CG06-09_8_20_14_all_51_20]PIY26363.1 MAG: hypothetical protein COZ11_02895 [Deltaproteobacteria bacterium CG_4_10_14_3_um_filter_51_14]PJB38177.1 MAG: hypothetical protein CO107_02905 [Deltaproteobacteria bacterium CG_4_9_14_3_um_filter_51_14]